MVESEYIEGEIVVRAGAIEMFPQYNSGIEGRGLEALDDDDLVVVRPMENKVLLVEEFDKEQWVDDIDGFHFTEDRDVVEMIGEGDENE